jgi:hypothetical protein
MHGNQIEHLLVNRVLSYGVIIFPCRHVTSDCPKNFVQYRTACYGARYLGGAIHGDFIVVRTFARNAQKNRDREA